MPAESRDRPLFGQFPRSAFGDNGAAGEVCSGRVSLHLVDDESVLLDPQAQRIYRLNQASTLLWCCFADGWSEMRTRELFEERGGVSSEVAANWMASTLAEWRDMGLIGDGRSQSVTEDESATEDERDAPSSLRGGRALPRGAMPPSTALSRLRYRILDTNIDLHGLPFSLANAMDEALGHLGSARSGSGSGSAPVICTLIDAAEEYVLTDGDRVVDRCAAQEAVVPMVKAALIRIAIDRAAAFAVVHAAAVYRDGPAVVLPGPSGTGKSTLAANLVLDGWALAAEDITVLGHDQSFPVRPLPTALCLKRDAWPVIAGAAPQVERLTVHRRADGKSVRYFSPRRDQETPGVSPAVAIGLIAFPRYTRGAPLSVRPLSLIEAFDRFLSQFYPVSNRFDGKTIDRLIGLLRGVPAIELCYGDGAEAVDAIRTWSK